MLNLLCPYRFALSNPFSPASISGLTMWFDADELSTITKDGNELVSQWDDKSGNNRHATQFASLAVRPVYVSNGINGMGSLDFTEPDQLALPDMGILGSTSRTAFVVARVDNSIDSQHFFGIGRNLQRGAWGLLVRKGGAFGLFLFGDDYDSSLLPGTDPHVFGGKLNGTTLGDNTLYMDGVSEQAAGAGVVNTDSGMSAIGHVVQFPADDGNALDGQIGELLIYDSALSDAERQKVEGYLAHKWGLVANLPGGHPFKLSPP